MAVFNNRQVVKVDAATKGGVGTYYRECLLEGEENLGQVNMYGVITIEPGTKMGYHQHVGDWEAYYILEGEGEYNDNGTIIPAKPGDVFRCADGDWHSISNTGDTNLVFVALIVKS